MSRFQVGDGVEAYFPLLEYELGQRIVEGLLAPIHHQRAEASYGFAHELAVWVSQVLGLPKVELKPTFYTHARDQETTTPCRQTPNGP